MRFILHTALFLVCSVIFLPAVAQVHYISDASITSCSGVLYDSGGPGGSGYGPNQSYTCTICPSTPGSYLSLNFAVFALDTTGVDDRLVIRDGDNVNASILGTFTGNALQGQVVVASANNITGCLTLYFTSNTTGFGVFAATLGCGSPCSPPFASFALPSDTVRMCSGELLAVDGSASFAAPGRTISQWNWIRSGFGTQTTTTPLADLDVPENGAAVLRLQVVDNLGCASTIAGNIPILVSGGLEFVTEPAPGAACVGSSIPLLATPVPVFFGIAGSECTDYGEPTPLPDDVGNVLNIPIQINTGQPGAVITDASELGDICMVMEHSFMGDLVISLTCPNGQTNILHQQGGSGTYLGSPNDTDSNLNPIPGECWTYCWNDAATNGTWVENISVAGNTTTAGTPPNQSLNPGTYESVQPLANLVGCPVNGTWILQVVDLWAADNGFLCSWCFGLSGSADSSFAELGPVLGSESPDSSFWSGPSVVNDASDATAATATASTAGPTDFTYTVTDSYGCVHSTVVSVHVVDAPLVNAGPDLYYCADSVQIEPVVMGGSEDPTCEWTLQLMDLFNDGWGPSAQVEVVVAGVSTVYTMPPGIPVVDYTITVVNDQSVQVFYTAAVLWNSDNSVRLFDADGNMLVNTPLGPATGLLYEGIPDCGGYGNVLWSPAVGLSNASILNPFTAPAVTTEYTLTITVPGPAGCSASDAVVVSTEGGAPFSLSYDQGTDQFCADVLDFDSYEWYQNGMFVGQSTGPCVANLGPGAWTAHGIDLQGCLGYSDTLLICPEITLTQNSGLLVTQVGFASYTWTWNGQLVSGANGSFLEAGASGLYAVTITTTYGCTVSASIEFTGFTGIGENSSSVPSFTIYPVPNDGRFTVSITNASGGSGSIRVLDMTGRVVHELGLRAIPEKGAVPVQVDLVPGAYFVELQLGGRKLVERVVVR